MREKYSFEVKNCCVKSLKRSKKMLDEIMRCNKWDYFITLTFNDEMQNRINDKEILAHWKNFRKYLRYNFPDIYYVSILERHKDGVIHFHMVVGGITANQLKLVNSGKKDKGQIVYNLYSWKYGYSTATKIRDNERVASYIQKYLGKDLGNSEEFKKRYYVSKNCERVKRTFKDFVYNGFLNVKDFLFNSKIYDLCHKFLPVSRLLFEKIVESSLTSEIGFYSSERNFICVKDFLKDNKAFNYLLKISKRINELRLVGKTRFKFKNCYEIV